jgi:hypothetical protein
MMKEKVIGAVTHRRHIGTRTLGQLFADLTRCAAECAVRFELIRANTGFFDTSAKCFRAGLVVGKSLISHDDRPYWAC